MSRFKWKLAKTGTFGNGERVSLKTPIGMGYDLTHKVSGTDGASVPFTVQFLNLGNTNKSLVDPVSLDSKRFNTNTFWAADGNGADQPNELYTNTTIAIKVLRANSVRFESLHQRPSQPPNRQLL